MRKLVVFNSISLDGYFTDANNEIGWAHRQNDQDTEYQEFVANNAKGEAELLFGRITYEMMVRFWPTDAAKKTAPDVAEGMNRLPKVVFSKSLDSVDWQNTKLVKGDPASEVKKMKREDGPDMVLMGSGTIVSQLTQHKLIDEYQLVVIPVVLGSGRTMFEGVDDAPSLKLTSSRTFKNGNVFLCYETT